MDADPSPSDRIRRDRGAVEQILGRPLNQDWPDDALTPGTRVRVVKDPEWDGPWQQEFLATIDSVGAPEPVTQPSARPGELKYWVTFDEPQLDSAGAGPYREAQIWGRHLRTVEPTHVMKAVRIPTTGPVEVIDLIEPAEDNARYFLTELYSTIGADSVECVRLTEAIDAWLDETGAVDGQPLNHLATHLARACGIDEPLHGVVVIVAADHDTGQSTGLTNDQIRWITQLATTLPHNPEAVRDEVTALAALGPLPSEDGPHEIDLFQTYEQHLHAITRPISIDEARVLVRLLPATEDSCFGMAWTLLHLIESCPDWPGDEDLGNGPWPDVLRQRIRNALS